ncbi:hypothetical protein [Telluribacter sp. SYSU D00476]|uniref:hypothetical protein n=1 Tax=Telluribacter sp. SYSU D00476 TaxID=2811430 RepID=UPI001FF3F902|nr:hypothetical protein [Telluribacter sp. SYSU D00476]
MLLLISAWIVLSVIVGILGDDRTCGFVTAFIVSLIFSPFVGLAVVFASKSKDELEFQKQMLEWNLEHAIKLPVEGTREEELCKEIGKLEIQKELGKVGLDYYQERMQGLKRAILYNDSKPTYVSMQEH